MRATIGRVAAATTAILAFGSAALYAGEAIVEPSRDRVVSERSDRPTVARAGHEATATPAAAATQTERKVRIVGQSFFPDE